MRLFPLLAAAGMLSGCGYIASPLPPLANIPARIVDVAAIQRGRNLVVQFTLPRLTTEGVQLRPPLRIELRIGAGPVPWNESVWAATARRIPESAATSPSGQPLVPGALVHYEVPATEWIGKTIVVGAETVGANGKPSGWSNVVNVSVIAPPETPTDLHAELTPAGLRLTWKARGDHFRVLRAVGPTGRFDTVATVTQPEWTDPNVQVGTEYRYMVQTFVPQPDNREAQSELSAPLTVTPQPIPPVAPTGLRAVPAPTSVELSWEGQADATAYRIYRGEPGGPLARIGETGAVPTYSDHTAQHGRNYRYAVTAVNAAGQESPQSSPVDIGYP